MAVRSLQTGLSRYFSPADQAHVRWLAKNTGTLLAGQPVNNANPTFEDDRGIGSDSRWTERDRVAESDAALANALDAWFAAKRVADEEGLRRAGRWVIEANDLLQSALGVDQAKREPLPQVIVEEEAKEIAELPRTAQMGRLASLLAVIAGGAQHSVAGQILNRLAPSSRFPQGERDIATNPAAARALPSVVDFPHSYHSGQARPRTQAAPPSFVPLSHVPGHTPMASGCEELNNCPTNEKLTCSIRQRYPRDTSGEGYGYATRRGWWWDDQVIVKYGCYSCRSESGKTCGFVGPGKPGTHDLYGGDFVVDPRKPREYPPEMFEAIRKGIKNCTAAKTCTINNPPP